MSRKGNAITFLILLALLLEGVSAQNCQYYDIETYVEAENVLIYKDTSIIAGKALQISEFSNNTNIASFLVYNPNSYEVLAVFNFTVEGLRDGEKAYGVKIGAGSYKRISESCYDSENSIFVSCSITPSTVSYHLTKPEEMYPAVLDVAKNRTVCNKPCSTASDCMVGTCNIAGVCGPEKIVPCPEGTTNCNDERCLKPSIKPAGSAYSCEWECESGIGTEGVCKLNNGSACTQPQDCLSGECNFARTCGKFVSCPEGTLNCSNLACVKPSIKEVGESYQCEWECATGQGSKGICQETTSIRIKQALRFVGLLLLIGLIAAVTIKVIKSRRIEERARVNAEKAKEEAKAEIQEMKNRTKAEIKEMEKKLGVLKQDEHSSKKEITRLEVEIEQRREMVESVDKNWERIKKPFPSEAANDRLVIVNPFLGGYLCFYKESLPLDKYPLSSLLHRWVWYKHTGYWPRPGYHIHHKNGNKRDNRIENLEEVQGEEHFEMHRSQKHP